MNKKSLQRLILILIAVLPQLALGALKDVMSQDEFIQLAEDLSKKVNLFAEVWRENPDTRIYGGSTRDYLLWVKRQFKDVKTREQANEVIQNLRARQVIEIKEFLTPQSDIDLIGNLNKQPKPEQFGIKRVDLHPASYLTIMNDAFVDEIRQGFLPAEKIQLNAQGLKTLKEFGDGVREIYEGRFTAQMTSDEVFKSTHWAQKGLNHQILLSLRYLRLISNHAYTEFGQDTVEINRILPTLDPKSLQAVEAIVRRCLDGQELRPFLQQELFRKWLNGTIQKSFSTYTNRWVASALFKYFRVEDLPKLYSGIEPFNQYITARASDPIKVQKFLSERKVNSDRLYDSVRSFFNDGYLYHGTSSEDAFRGIILQGVLSSKGGAAGPGLYGVASSNIKAAIQEGGHKDLLLKFKIKPDAKIVDITRGEGRRLYLEMNVHYDEFAEKVGADILKYHYEYGEAFVVKNTAVLEKAEGVYKTVRSFDQTSKKFSQLSTAAEKFSLLLESKLSQFEVETILKLHPEFKIQFAMALVTLPTLAAKTDIKTSPASYLDIYTSLARATNEGLISPAKLAEFFIRNDPAKFDKSIVYNLMKEMPVSESLKLSMVKYLTGQVQPNWNDPQTFSKAVKQISILTSGYVVDFASYFNQFIQVTPEAIKAFMESKPGVWEKVVFEEVIFPRKAAQLGKEFIRDLILKHPKSYPSLAKFFARPESLAYAKEFQLLIEQSKEATIELLKANSFSNFKNQPIESSIVSALKWIENPSAMTMERTFVVENIFAHPEFSKNTRIVTQFLNSLKKDYPYDSKITDALTKIISAASADQNKVLLRSLLENGSSDLIAEVSILLGESSHMREFTPTDLEVFRKAATLPTNLDRQIYFNQAFGQTRIAPHSCNAIFI